MLWMITRAQTLGWLMRDRLRGEAGQTSSEYLVIAGVAVALIVGLLSIFSKDVNDGMKEFAGKMKGYISSGK